jgi:two-component system response regulator RstA
LEVSDRKRILLIEDDVKLASLIREYLARNGFSVDIHNTGKGAVDKIIYGNPDLVILDIMLPETDGISICKSVRPEYVNPILMLTARGEEDDELIGLESGADDYMAKPVQPRLLKARINTLLRRNQRGGKTPDRIELSNMVIDSGRQALKLDGNWIDLTTAEFELLWLLASNAGKPLSRDMICSRLRGFEYNGLDRSIDLRITRLRKKIGDDARKPQIIKSIRGKGYMLAS